MAQVISIHVYMQSFDDPLADMELLKSCFQKADSIKKQILNCKRLTAFQLDTPEVLYYSH